MKKEYEYYFIKDSHDSCQPLVDGKEMQIEVRDPETLQFMTLKGKLHCDAKNYPDAPLVWVKTEKELEKEPWAIEIKEVKYDDEEIHLERKPHVRVAYGGKKGRMLADMLSERMEKEKK